MSQGERLKVSPCLVYGAHDGSLTREMWGDPIFPETQGEREREKEREREREKEGARSERDITK